MNTKIRIFANSREQYVKAITDRLQRGSFQAGVVYNSWMKHGRLPEGHKAFRNCPELFKALEVSHEFTCPDCELQAERRGHRMLAVRTPNHDGILMFGSLVEDDAEQPLQVTLGDFQSIPDLYGGGGVEDVVARRAEVDVPPGIAARLSQG